jgi:anti-sigma B factor antagonist
LADELHVEINRVGPATAVSVRGELDLASVPAVDDVLMGLIEHDTSEILVDLGDVEFMDVAGLRALLNVRQAARERGHTVKVTNVSRQVNRLLEIVGKRELLADGLR